MLSPLTVYAAQPGDMIVSYCENYVAMRAEPSTDVQVIGRLANLSAATVIGAQVGYLAIISLKEMKLLPLQIQLLIK